VSEPTRHHYIPVFYLKQWCGTDGGLCEFSRPYKETKAKRKAPKATGYMERLYTVPSLPEEDQQFVEKRFLQQVDSQAAEFLRFILSSPRTFMDIGIERKIAWSRFLYSLMVRTPQVLEYMQRKIDTDPDHPHVSLAAPELLPGLMNSKKMIPVIANMSWSAAYLDSTRFPMLTSDRPLIMTNGLAKSDAHMAIPLTPRVLFLAVKEDHMYREIKR
jgi:hypothetical protein